mmetsp:Transcript_43277/g.50674  ORF Transcript_43277/g.50674 Transcript_43277/m.50674 type:complete len:453 (-) Transcript_43277:949-2307(-)
MSEPRVIILLDLDCFYAQCEIVRLGLDPSIPLALLQWNSALAVNYPARALGIKRGDSFQAIREAGGLALHLEVIPVQPLAEIKTISTNNSCLEGNHSANDESLDAKISEIGDDNNVENNTESIEDAYNKLFRLPQCIRNDIYQKEKNRMRNPREGKASLERYRLASSMIFQVILEGMNKCVGKGNFILERASIDELYLDVTDHCNEILSSSLKEDEEWKNDKCSPLIKISKEEYESVRSLDNGNEDLWRGCEIAKEIRQFVFNRLGFTLSAGVSLNKTLAKLGAGYGKPNNQAIILPHLIPEVMKITKVRKVRNFGGKVGKKVISMLPENKDTMASVAEILTLDSLTKTLGIDMGRWVFDACRGIDNEVVKETVGILTKSITAFKSFPKADYNSITKWIVLLVTDIVNRVEQDTERNCRSPKSCTIQYTSIRGKETSDFNVRFYHVCSILVN